MFESIQLKLHIDIIIFKSKAISFFLLVLPKITIHHMCLHTLKMPYMDIIIYAKGRGKGNVIRCVYLFVHLSVA